MFKCKNCNKKFTLKTNLLRHYREVCGTTSSIIDDDDDDQQQPITKKPRKLEGRKKTTTFCEYCRIQVSSYSTHSRSLQHKENSQENHPDNNIKILTQAFKGRLISFRIYPIKSTEKIEYDIEKFLNSLKLQIIELINDNLKKFTTIKCNMELFGQYYLQSKDKIEIKSFNSKYKVLTKNDDVNDFIQLTFEILRNKASEFQEKDSGWALLELLFLELNVSKFNPLRASSFIPLPKCISIKKAVVNIKNDDNMCFKWCVLAHLHPVSMNAHRVNHYLPFENELNFTNLVFPISLIDINKFEVMNNISINVYGLELNDKQKYEVVGPLHFTSQKRPVHVNLLLLSDDDDDRKHYCLIKNMSRLLTSQINNHGHSTFLCDGCLIFFTSERNLFRHQLHDCNHIYTKLPTTEVRKNKTGKLEPENKLKFDGFEKKMIVPFVVYADFESILHPIDFVQPNSNESYTIRTQKHIPFSFGYYIKCNFDENLSKFYSYRGENCTTHFINQLILDSKNIFQNYLQNPKPLNTLTNDQLKNFENAIICHICENSIENEMEKVIDHCHLTGEYRGAAHSICNLNFKIPKFIPIFFHNLSNYDAHLFVRELGLNEEKIDVIAQNKEKYISFSKTVIVDAENRFKLRFLDSFRFMSSSLQNLAQNLKEFTTVKKHFSDPRQFDLIKQKGVFPYSYLDSMEKLKDTQLPAYEDFNDTFNDRKISENDYKRAHDVWNLFECKTLGEYSDLYLKTDVFLLTDVFENFRQICLNIYNLDPAQYYTAPGLSWDAMLKYTKVELELFTDIDMLHFIKKGIRGGISQCSKRSATANNIFMSNYDKNKPSIFITYLDATNLYGAAMSNILPLDNFKWLTEEEINNFRLTEISLHSETGYILEVDLNYPENLHDSHNELPFCAESIVPPHSKKKIKKLIPNLNDKKKYIIHVRNLKQALDNGLQLIKIHRILTFRQCAWLKPYIDLNTNMRNQAANKFEKDFYKLMNNSVFGKTMENVDKRVDVRLLPNWKRIGKRDGVETLIVKPNFKNFSIFSENLVAVQMNRLKINYFKPIHVGFTVLELSKLIIYDFYYGFLKSKYKDKLCLLYTDTDSLISEVETENFYQDMKENLEYFDTSNFKENNNYDMPISESVIGRMKDEYAGKILWEFVGTGAKAYIVNYEGNLTPKAKGIPYYKSKCLTMEDYRNVVTTTGSCLFQEFKVFRSYLHDIYTELKNRIALSYSDDKRFLLDNSRKTLAWGHYKISRKKNSTSSPSFPSNTLGT